MAAATWLQLSGCWQEVVIDSDGKTLGFFDGDEEVCTAEQMCSQLLPPRTRRSQANKQVTCQNENGRFSMEEGFEVLIRGTCERTFCLAGSKLESKQGMVAGGWGYKWSRSWRREEAKQGCALC